MIKKILIANRGEIACRIARTARLMGIKTIAVYSDIDGEALHVEACDEAVALGGASAADSYLSIDKIIQAAQICSVDAIHPGYGFLSENSKFAARCVAEKIIFIGPSPESIRAMGSKSAARQAMVSAGVSVLPGYDDVDQDIAVLTHAANKIGFPILIKAVSGGGGKGMRIVDKKDDFASALESAKRESLAAFSDNRVLLEKFLPVARHIEVQIFADQNGNVVHLFERDCSLQRRHQKVLEESPAPGIGENLRQSITNAAIECAQSIGYVGAGTVEFLLAPDNHFYFMEMNTRLQVEHPVTELVTGQDLVAWQIKVAQGENLPCQQSEIAINGHAIEARIYAENPEQEFLPCSGNLLIVDHPEQQFGIRVDTGVQSGDRISTYYDPMISKLIAWGPNRNSALQKLSSALQSYVVLGIRHNIEFLHNLVSHPVVQEKHPDTLFIENNTDNLLYSKENDIDLTLACAGCYILLDDQKMQIDRQQQQEDDSWSPWSFGDGWQNGISRQVTLRFLANTETYTVPIKFNKNTLTLDLTSGSEAVTARLQDQNHLKIEFRGRITIATIAKSDNDIFIHYNGSNVQLKRLNLFEQKHHSGQYNGSIESPMPGSVIAVTVAENDQVISGQTLVIVEAMKMEHQIKAPTSGLIQQINCAVGDQIREGHALMVIK